MNQVQLQPQQQLVAIPGNQTDVGAAVLANQALREKSGQRVQALLDAWPEITPETDLLSTDALDANMADAQSKLSSCLTIMENRRKPITRAFDDVRDMFTSEEKAIKEMSATIQASRIAWQKEKLRREKERKDKADLALIKNAEAIDIAAKAKTIFATQLVRLLADSIKKVNDTYNSHTAESLPEYGNKLSAWTPGFTQASDTFCRQGDRGTWFYHTAEEVDTIFRKAFDEAAIPATANYSRDMRAERDRLIELIPSRIAELKRGEGAARVLREDAERAQNTEQQVAAVEQTVAVSAESEKHEAVFEAVATAGPAISVAKGTSQKKKYAPATMAEHVTILQYWVKNAMPTLSQEELIKRLSFTRTFADKALNDGEVIEGVTIVEDVSVRGRRKDDE